MYKQDIIIYLFAAVLATLPLKNIFVSIATILFVLVALVNKKKNITIQKEYVIPIALFLLMTFSVLWSIDMGKSLLGLQKALPLAVVPLTFFILRKLKMESKHKIFKWYSFAMVLFSIYYLLNAFIAFVDTKNTDVLFSNNLVPVDPGAIYLSVFSSFALFYFIQIKTKNIVDKSSIFVLTALIFLLSSKSIITIDFIIIICYYTFFVTIPSGTKAITILSVSAFFVFSVLFVKEVRNRFLIEYETAFIDNTLNYDLTKEKQNIYNVSIKEAWTKSDFHQNSFFPGTALRIYQMRIFIEILREEQVFFSGFGLEASQNHIRNKAKEHNLDAIYGEYNFHNQYLQTFADIGILGFLILILMVVINLKNAIKHKDFLHIAFAITMIMLFLSESFFCRQRGIVFFIILYCLFNTTSIEKIEEKSL